MPRKSTTKKRKAKCPRDRFLTAYSLTGNITQAAKAAKIDRKNHYNWLQKDPEYPALFDAADDEAADTLEKEARRRAIEGTRRLKFTAGGEAIQDPETGEPYEELSYSDTLLIFLLKGSRPEKYRERSQVDLDAKVESSAEVVLYFPDNGRDGKPED